MHSLICGASKVPAWLLDADLHRLSLHGILAFDWFRHDLPLLIRQVKRMIPQIRTLPVSEGRLTLASRM